MPSNDPRQTKAQRQAEARARAAQLRAQQERTAKRNRILGISIASIAALALIGAFVFVFAQNQQNKTRYDAITYGQAASGVVAPELTDTVVKAPSVADADGGIPVSDEGVGKAGAGDTVLSVYFDLQCPGCKSFDEVNADDLKTLSSEPGITVMYQPLAFLDRYSSGTYYSSRAANAAMAVADQDPDHFLDFITALFTDQPEENSSGLTDDRIAEIAAGVGVPQSVIDTFTATVEGTFQVQDSNGTTTDQTGSWRTYSPFMAATTAHAQQTLGSISTPTLLLDGSEISGQNASEVAWNQPGALAAYVRDAAQAKAA
jgi:protein-disulfide isomerase